MNLFCVDRMSIFALALVTGLSLIALPKAFSQVSVGTQNQTGDMQFFDDNTNNHASIRMTLITGDTLVAKSLATIKGLKLLSAKTNHPVEFDTHIRKGNRYVIPKAAVEAVNLGLVDIELFNVSKLFKMGMDDSQSKSISILIKYHKQHKPEKIAGVENSVMFESINTQLVTFNKQTANKLWNDIVSNLNIQKVWLDEPMQNQ